VSYLVAAYAVVTLGVALYAAWLARARRALAREVASYAGTKRG
jgi:CcmD family protein